MVTLELALALECCRWTFAGGRGRVDELAERMDWARVVRLARFHRVQGLVWNCLSALHPTVPPRAAEALAADAADIAAANLRSAVECRELLTQFSRSRVPLLFVKGVTLGALAYANPHLKMAWDIDLLICERDLTAAAQLLRRRGYELAYPRSGETLGSWHRREKESVWNRVNEGLHVELHTRLADNRRLIPDVTIDSPRQDVEVAPGIVLPTLAPDELFAYLCVHGASSLWFRLKWITDFAALLHPLPPAEVERLYRRSQDLGAGRAADQALLVSDSLYSTLVDVPDLKRKLAADPTSRWLAKVALLQLAGRDEPVEPTSARGGTAAIHYTQLMLLPGFSFKLSELLRQARAALS